MRQCVVFLLVAALLACMTVESQAQFSFSLPGKWGHGKRSMGMADLGKCGQPDPAAIIQIIETVQSEALRMNECLRGGSDVDSRKAQSMS